MVRIMEFYLRSQLCSAEEGSTGLVDEEEHEVTECEGELAFMAMEVTHQDVRAHRAGRYLFTLDALQGVLFLIAGHTEILVVLRDEALGPDWLLAAMADEAGLMPAAAFILHLAGACREG